MSTTTDRRPVLLGDSDLLGARRARPLAAALATDSHPPRILISGGAGSGKTVLLRRAQRYLADLGTPLHVFGPDTEVPSVPASSVLLVDDLHLLAPEQLEELRARAQNPEAALVVASRPWPTPPDSLEIMHHLERSHPAVVLGHASRSDVMDFASEIPAGCVGHILDITAGVAWLVAAAVEAHDERDCADDVAHHTLDLAVQQSVLHRLSVADAGVRRVVEAACVSSPEEAADSPTGPIATDGVLAQAHAEGLLLRNGRPAPVVRAAVRANLSVRSLADLVASLPDTVDPIGAEADWLQGVRSDQWGTALSARADRIREADPPRALALYRAAAQAGSSSAELSVRLAELAWVTGDIDDAAQHIDEAMVQIDADSVVRGQLADAAAAVWSQRGMLRTGILYYDALSGSESSTSAPAVIASIAAGQVAASPLAAAERSLPPSTLTVALTLLRRGLETSVASTDIAAGVADLTRAAHLHTAARTTTPLVELPQVIATVAAISCGELSTARAIIERAIDAHHGTPWVLSRLLLWNSWVALQQARAGDARESLSASLAINASPSRRDEMLVHAIRVGLARRFDDSAALAAAWRECKSSLLDADVDLFLLLPLVELVSASARVGDSAATRILLSEAIRLIESLGTPPLWSCHVHWAGIQRGILLNEPDSLGPHAHALVRLSETNEVAAVMARAGKLWTSVLAGTVDADQVESAARELRGVGLTWDAARLASHGARRTTDRKESARLLACAREIHPVETVRTEEVVPSVLSERETDVARLVVQGKTYAEIGETIFISPRTAEHHIASIRRRLGATTRSDLIAKLRIALNEPEPTESRRGASTPAA